MKKQNNPIRPGDVLQIRFSPSENWLDYGTISQGEEGEAMAKINRGVHQVNLEGKKAEFRVVRKFMGTNVVAGPRV